MKYCMGSEGIRNQIEHWIKTNKKRTESRCVSQPSKIGAREWFDSYGTHSEVNSGKRKSNINLAASEVPAGKGRKVDTCPEVGCDEYDVSAVTVMSSNDFNNSYPEVDEVHIDASNICNFPFANPERNILEATTIESQPQDNSNQDVTEKEKNYRYKHAESRSDNL